ncbi:hypothetical protein J3F84DRAFT_358511 [Trichoderma pleuroticola]
MMNRYELFFIIFLQARLLACLAPTPVLFACKRLLTCSCTARTVRPLFSRSHSIASGPISGTRGESSRLLASMDQLLRAPGIGHRRVENIGLHLTWRGMLQIGAQ